MSYLNPTDSEYVDRIAARIAREGRDRTRIGVWMRTADEVLRGNGVTDPASLARRKRGIKAEINRRSIVVRTLRAAARTRLRQLHARIAS